MLLSTSIKNRFLFSVFIIERLKGIVHNTNGVGVMPKKRQCKYLQLKCSQKALKVTINLCLVTDFKIIFGGRPPDLLYSYI